MHSQVTFASCFVPYQKRDDILFVFLQRRGGVLRFWGGGREGDETKEETLLREVKEELDYTPESFSFFGEYDRGPKYRPWYIFTEKVGDNFEQKIKILEGEWGGFLTKEEIKKDTTINKEALRVLSDLFDKFS